MNHAQFLFNYARLITNAWSSEENFDRATTQPREALAMVDIVLPPNAHISVTILDDPREGRVEHQVAQWEKGERTGFYELFIARKPEGYGRENEALSDEAFSDVAGGQQASMLCCTSAPL